MLYQKKVSVGAQYAKKGEDIKDGDIITILDEGQVVVGKYGEQNVHKIKTRNGDRALNLNQTSINNLVDAYGVDGKEWVGKTAKVWIIKAMVSGKFQNIVYLSKEDWTMTDEGRFVNPNAGDESEIGYPDNEEVAF